MMIKNFFYTLLLCCLSFCCCGNGENTGDGLQPALSITIAATGSTSVTLDVNTVNASHITLLCEATGDTGSRTAAEVVSGGTKYTQDRIVIEGLEALTQYTVFAVACNDRGEYGNLQTVQFETMDDGGDMYSWEKERSGIPSFTDMVLCYGGSRHRSPYLWQKERFEPFVTYIDEQGTEHWLFDSFLFIEFISAGRPDEEKFSFMVGHQSTSAGKAIWQELIDYWFDSGNGMNALEETVKEATARLGTPPTKRKVIMTMPDPIIYKQFAEISESTTYWGQINGRTLDFSVSSDRIAAYRWYINEVRKRFDQGNYRHIELAGFYIVSEELVSPDDGWNHELKKTDEVIPYVSEYLHSLNHSVSWIPYNRAAGYARWKNFGVDYAYMQPNYYWDDAGTKPLSRFFSDINTHNLAMELEFDDELLEGKADPDIYRSRLREYMNGARSNGVYGSKPLAYYQGDNAVYDLSVSSAEKDREMYHEFCRFVINNPLRK